MKDSFVYHIEWFEVIEDLEPAAFAEINRAIILYATQNIEPSFSTKELTLLFRLIRRRIDCDNVKYQKTSNKKAQAGKLGAEKRWQTKIADDGKNGTCHKRIAKIAKDGNDGYIDIDIDNDIDNDINKNDTSVSQKGKRFTRPSVEDVRAYCQERKNGIDPEAFIDHYEAKGWLIGKQPMKDWRAAVRTWERSRSITPSDVPALNTSAQQVPEWRVLEEGNPNNPPAKEWAAFLEYLDQKKSKLVITGPQYMKVKVMAQYDKQDFRRVINDLIRMAPIQTSIEQEADHLLDMYRINPNYQAPINPKSNQKE